MQDIIVIIEWAKLHETSFRSSLLSFPFHSLVVKTDFGKAFGSHHKKYNFTF